MVFINIWNYLGSKMAKKIIIVISLIISLVQIAVSQDKYSELSQEELDSLLDPANYELNPRYGIYGHFGYNLHFANFTGLPGIPSCCPEFTFASGTGLSAGFLYEYPLNKKIYLQMRAGYTVHNAQFVESEATIVFIDGTEQQGEFEHRLDAFYHTIAIEPTAAYQVMPSLFLLGGLSAGLQMYNYYEQIEEISKPSDRGTFGNLSRTRNHNWGDIPDASSFIFGLNLGASYQLALNEERTLFLSPELMYNFNFLPPVSDVTWNMSQIRAGASIKYKQGPPPPPPPLPPIPAPLPENLELPSSPPTLFADINVVRVDSSGNEDPNFSIKIEDFISLNMRPLLNYIFFEENSSKIPDRYTFLTPSDTANFGIKQLENLNTLETYYHVLNIIGKRLNQNPNSMITIIGNNSNTEMEKGNLELSAARAESVKKYLNEVWGIADNRMDIRTRNLPKEATRSDELGGDDENRRVEIISSDLSITDPVVTNDTMRVVNNYNLRFLPEAMADAGIKNWNMILNKENEELLSKSGKNNIPEFIDWSISNDDRRISQKSGFLTYTFKIEDSLGQKYKTEEKRLPVERLTIDRKRLERIEDKEFEYYSLILFDYGKSSLAREHRKVVDLIKNRVSDEAKVYINGYTDSLGSEEINKKISEQRAKSVAERLNIKEAQVQGIGEQELLYDNSLPEGRFYCRTVQIIIETPVLEDRRKK